LKISKVVFLDENNKEVTKEVTDGFALLYNQKTNEILVQDTDIIKLNLMAMKRLFKRVFDNTEEF